MTDFFLRVSARTILPFKEGPQSRVHCAVCRIDLDPGRESDIRLPILYVKQIIQCARNIFLNRKNFG